MDAVLGISVIGIIALKHAYAQWFLDAILSGVVSVALQCEDLEQRLVGFGGEETVPPWG